MATRKENFWKYYKANPDKLKGKSIEQAYAAMRKQAGIKGLKQASVGGTSRDAIDRRLNRARGMSAANRPQGPYKPLTVSDVANPLGREVKRQYHAANQMGDKINKFIKGNAKQAYAATPAAKRKAAIERRRKAGLSA